LTLFLNKIGVWDVMNSRIMVQWVCLSLVGLPVGVMTWATSARANPVEPLVEQNAIAQPLPELNAPATTVAEWEAQIAQSLVQVTGVELNPTQAGLNLVLTASGPLGVPPTRTEGNTLIAEIPNAVLKEAFEQANPTAEIALVRVTNIAGDRVRVEITGTNAPPAAQISGNAAGLTVAVSTATEPVAETEEEEDPEEEELIVTGQQEGGYAVPNASVGTKTDTPIKDVPQSIQVIPQQVIEDQGAITVGDALRNSSSGNGFGREVFENGLTGLRGFFGSRGDSGDIDLSNIEQIEVLRGPASVLYGVGRAGGVVNLTTKQPLDKPFYRLEGSVGNLDFYRASIDFTGPLNSERTVLYRLNAAYRDTGSPTDFVSRQEFTIYPTLSVQFSKDTKLTFEVGYTEFTRIPDGGGLPALGTLLPNPLGRVKSSLFLGEPDFSRERFWAGSFGYRFEHQINSNWQLKNRFQYAFSNYDLQNVIPVSLAEDNRTVLRQAFVNKGRDKDWEQMKKGGQG
jgi:iron complex outermembrane receptor protein